MQMPAANATPALQRQLEHDLFGKPVSTFPDHPLVPIEEVMDVVQANDAHEDQINGDNVIEQPRHDEDQDAGDKCDQRRDMGRRDDHDLNLLVELCDWDEWNADTGKARQHTQRGNVAPGSSRIREIRSSHSGKAHCSFSPRAPSFRGAAERRARNP